jgi:hypothetical protein
VIPSTRLIDELALALDDQEESEPRGDSCPLRPAIAGVGDRPDNALTSSFAGVSVDGRPSLALAEAAARRSTDAAVPTARTEQRRGRDFWMPTARRSVSNRAGPSSVAGPNPIVPRSTPVSARRPLVHRGFGLRPIALLIGSDPALLRDIGMVERGDAP